MNIFHGQGTELASRDTMVSKTIHRLYSQGIYIPWGRETDTLCMHAYRMRHLNSIRGQWFVGMTNIQCQIHQQNQECAGFGTCPSGSCSFGQESKCMCHQYIKNGQQSRSVYQNRCLYKGNSTFIKFVKVIVQWIFKQNNESSLISFSTYLYGLLRIRWIYKMIK